MRRRVWEIAWPLVLTNLTVPLLGLVDTAVVGHLSSPVYLAALGISVQIFTILAWSMAFLRMSTSGFSAEAFGKQNPNLSAEVLQQGLIIAALGGSLIYVCHPWIIPVALDLMESPAPVWGPSNEYLLIRLLGLPLTLGNFVVAGWLIGHQRTRPVMVLALLMHVVNISLDLLFVVGLDMKVAGVAWASLIAEGAALIAGLYFCQKLLPVAVGHIQAGTFHWKGYRKLFNANVLLFVRTLAIIGTLAFFISRSASQGVIVLAVNTVLLNFVLIVANALDGFANAAEALVGENLAAKRLHNVRKVVKAGLEWSCLLAIVLAALFQFGGNGLLDLLTDLTKVRSTALNYLPWLILLPAVAVWCFLYDGVFIGLLQPFHLMVSVWLAAILGFLPAWYLLQGLGNHGLWAALVIYFFVRSLYLWVIWQKWSAPGY